MERDLIILAEDKASQRKDFIEAFETLGFQVRAYPDGVPALKAVTKLSPQERARAILVTDFSMSEMGGVGLSNEVRTRFPEIPVMLWSDGGITPNTRIASKANFATHKSFTPDRIRCFLDEALAQFAQETAHPSVMSPKSPFDHGTRPPQEGKGPRGAA